MIERLQATAAAQQLVAQLRAQHGPLLLYQSHGCCEGSAPMCFKQGEMGLGPDDLQLGTVAGVPFYLSRGQLDYLASMQLTLDVAAGDGGTYSLEDGSGQHFVMQLRLFTDAESAALARQEAALG
ncbi:DUF779 domain-containing protein [Ideonella sp.]|uniref:DUF779 domain-containing protein n=1 Tax=Ideonella sp. TaxID=1929293 RepID=UPI003BB7C889